MTKEDIIKYVKAGKPNCIYKHIGQCTNYFDYDQLDDIISNLDNRKQMKDFATIASDEYDSYYKSRGELFDRICIKGPFGGSPKYEDNILPTLEDMISRAVSRKEIEAKYATTNEELLITNVSEPISTPTEWLEASNNVVNSMGAINKEITNWLEQIQSTSKQGLEQLQRLKDKSYTTLNNQFAELSAKYEKLIKEHQKYVKWFEDWNTLKDEIAAECYDHSEIQEAGLDDPSAMYEAVQAAVESSQNEKRLKEENKLLRTQQEAWRERPEYKEEIAKLETKVKMQISVEQIRQGILAYANNYSKIEDLCNFLLRVNRMLKQTAWDAVADDVEREALEVFKRNLPSVTNNFYKGSQNVEHLDHQDNTYHK